MLTTRTRRLAVAALSALALTSFGCTPAGLTEPGGSSAPSSGTTSTTSPGVSASPTPTQSPTPTPTPTPSADPGALVKGANHIGSATPYVYPAALVQQWLEGEVKPTEKVVFLTFDDGPNHTTTPIILDALEKADVHATFFVVGSMLGEAPELLKREVAEGNSVGLHSWSHNYKKLYPGRVGNTEHITDEYLKTLAKVREILGPDFNTESWRYPGGHMSWKKLAAADAVLLKHGVSWIDWNADTADSAPKKSRPTTVDGIVQNATAPIRDGYHVAVILAHDTPDKKLTAQSVSSIIAAYKQAGYSFGVIS